MKHKSPAAQIAWTDARIALLKRLRSEGVSCSKIAAALGGVSRSAVVGKIRRLRLPPSACGPRQAGPRAHASDGRTVPPLITARRAGRKSVRPEFAIATLEQFNAAIPIWQRRTLWQLTRSSCRWPVGEPNKSEFFFCGGQVEEGRPYCTGHCGFAYQQAEHPSRKFKYATGKSIARPSRICAWSK
jgi:GcrA cell cycle regulator